MATIRFLFNRTSKAFSCINGTPTQLLKTFSVLISSALIFKNSASYKTLIKDFALAHFDQFYGSTFENWASIRLGLLCPHSYCAVVNSFSNPDRLTEYFEDLGAYNIKEVYESKFEEYQAQEHSSFSVEDCLDTKTNSEVYDINKVFENVSIEHNENALITDVSESGFVQTTKLKSRDSIIEAEDYASFYDADTKYNVNTEKEKPIEFPKYLNVYMFPRGKFKEFPPPQQDDTGLFNYYLMDGSSILPVLALDVREGEEVGDLCSSPGGKCLAILFSLKFGKIICNDVSLSRVKKLKTVLNSYLPSAGDWNKKILISNIDVSTWEQFDIFDKVLLDVPCTNDRLSVTRDGNNIFKQDRFHERMMLPQKQTEMLCIGLQTLKPGGSLVYSTCSLSPIQNDGVVHIALSKLSTQSNKEFVVQDLTDAFYPVQELFQFSDMCHYGKLVVPFLPLNYGPMYICKIKRV